MILLLASLLWPAPCADPDTCWIKWNQNPANELILTYEIWSNGVLCYTNHGHRRPKGSWARPNNTYIPRPGPCYSENIKVYQIKACNNFGCSGLSEGVEIGYQHFMCFTSLGQVPCES